ncbi:MAG: Maf family protein [Planctomycetota bacterium]|jgi:septum formation protein
MLLLASRSPRRRQLLDEASIPFEVIDGAVDDSDLTPSHVDPSEWAAALAYLKAESAARTLTDTRPGAVVLGADTIVVKRDQIIGKPRDRDHARQIITTLRDGSHRVITGVALLKRATGSRTMLTDDTIVRVGQITNERVESYLQSDDWKGKAGAYNLMERVDDGWPITWEGDPTSVMGLPMRRLLPILQQLTNQP